MAQNTNLNVTPYYDDFDKDKNFYRVLFRPGYPIQARELTTMQSILQNQVENMGSHLFKEGSMVIPGQVGYDLNVDAIMLQESFLGANVEDYRSQLEGKIIEGLTTGVRAKVLFTLSGANSTKGYITLYVKYLTSGDDAETADEDAVASQETFQNNEQLITDKEITFGTTLIEVGSPFAQLLPTDALQVGSVAYVQEGVYYIRGFFVDVPYQYILLDQYGSSPAYRIGLEILESIVTPEDDLSLNDNAAGTSNYAAPGAHRFRITTNLVKKLLDDDADKDFIELLRINGETVEEIVERSAYDELEKTFALRTYEESGDYVVQDFDIAVRECLDDGFNNGVYDAGETTESGNAAAENLYSIEFGPGTAYVKGYRVSTISPTYVDALKPRTTLSKENSIVSCRLGNYNDVDNTYGHLNLSGDSITNAYQTIEFRDAYTATGGVAAGNRIGFARVAGQQFVDASDGDFATQADNKYRVYMFDIQMFTRIQLTTNQSIVAGSQVVGKSSGAKGYIVDAITSANHMDVYEIEGTFQQGEMITVDGLDKDTIEKVYAYKLSDARQILARDEGNSSVEFTADLSLKDELVIGGTSFTYDATSGSEKITGLNSNFARDLRAGDRIFFDADNYVDVDSVNPSNLSAGNPSTIFNFSDQEVNVTPPASNFPSAGTYNGLIRKRARLDGIEDGILLTPMPKTYVASISDESMIVRRTFDGKSVQAGAGNSVSETLPDNQQFESISNVNVTCTVLAGSNSTYPVGSNVPILTGISNAANIGYTTLNAEQNTITISNLTNITSVKITASISKNVTEKKTKTLQKMWCHKVVRTIEDRDRQLYGLAYSNIFGTRIEDSEISLGVVDAYKIHAIYESDDENDPIVPSVTLVEPVFFATGSVVTGSTSNATGRVIDFNSSTLKLSMVILDGTFQVGETVTGVDSNGTAISGIIDDSATSVIVGSKVITDRYTLYQGQTNYMYRTATLQRNKGVVTPIRKIMVVMDYFNHGAGGDYFAGQSYQNIDYSDIPFYDGQYLSDYLDFRPGIPNLYNYGSGTLADPAFITCSSLDFKSRVFPTSGSPSATLLDIPEDNSNFRCDFSWYIGRIDKIFLDQDGEFEIVKGLPAEEPEEPDDLETGMLLATLTYAPYGFDPDEDVQIERTDNKRYTMRDIGSLERRLDQVEYYTSLNMLESDTISTEVLDADGRSRLKNGFIVDDFTDHSKSAVDNQDFNAALDFEEGIARASHYTTNFPLEINDTLSSNVDYEAEGDDTDVRPLVTLPYTEEVIVDQPYASRVENVNPFNVFAFIGNVVLLPASDDWVSTRRLPTRVTRIEGNFLATRRRLRANRRGFAPIQWRSWRTTWRGQRTVSRRTFRSHRRSSWGRGRAVDQRTTVRVTRRQVRRGIRTRVVPRIDRRNLGDSLVSQTSIPWMRSRNIRITATRMKPRTRFYIFFGRKNITNYTTPKIIEVIKNPAVDNRTNSTPFQPGETIRGSRSKCRFLCLRPNNWYRSTTGTAFSPYDDTELPGSYSATTNIVNHNVAALARRNKRNGRYRGNMQVGEVLIGMTSGARAVVQRRRHMTDRFGKYRGNFFIPPPRRDNNPRWRTGTRTLRMTSEPSDSRVPGAVASAGEVEFTSSGTLRRIRRNVIAVRNASVVRDTVVQRRTVRSTRTSTRQVGWWDPLAQSFIINAKGGMFITSVDIYFRTKDARVPINMQIRTMENGYPTTTILPFADVTVEPDDVNISETGAVATRFTFPAPIFIPQSIEHCFALFSDSNEYQVWISRMGDQTIEGDRTISEQPYAGVLFKSQNASTWTADQYEDLKFQIYRAKFTPGQAGRLVLNNAELDEGNDGIDDLEIDAIETLNPELTLNLNSATLPYTIGARLYQKTSLAEGTISTITTTSDSVILTVKDVSGTFQQGEDTGSDVTYRLVSSKTTASITTTGTGSFTGPSGGQDGETVTGATSGATAEVVSYTAATGVLELRYVSKPFTAGENITGSQSNTTRAHDTGVAITYAGDAVESGAISDSFIDATINFASSQKRVRIYQDNHGMHDTDNNVVIEGAISEVANTTLTAAVDATGLSLAVNDATAFHKIINGLAIGSDNPGFLKIEDEIMEYESISSDGKSITIKSGGRGSSGTTAVSHASEVEVECYNLDGVPLTLINKTHTGILNPTIDTYEVETGKIATQGILGGGEEITATKNIMFSIVAPSIQTMILPKTSISARANMISATSINDGETMSQNSFVNTGEFFDVELSEDNYFTTPMMIASAINEQNELAGAKSFRMDITMETTVDNLTPVVDTDRFSIITTANRINKPSNPDNAKLAQGDPHEAVYITKIADLTNPSGAIKLMFRAYRPVDTEIKVLYRVLPDDSNDSIETFGFEYFPDPEDGIPAATEFEEYRDYEYEVDGIKFKQYQIKVLFVSPNQAYSPVIQDLRAIALAA